MLPPADKGIPIADPDTFGGGYVGPLVAAAAWYGSAAGVVKSTWGRTVLPVFPIARR